MGISWLLINYAYTLLIGSQDNIFLIFIKQSEELSDGEVTAIAVSVSVAGVIISKKKLN